MPGASQPRRTQAERRSESEEAVLQAAAELIAQYGVERASLARIGLQAGVSRGLPTHHFGSKDALVARLALRVQERVVAMSSQLLQERERTGGAAATAMEAILAVLDSYLELFTKPTAEAKALIVMWGATFPADASIDGMLSISACV